MQFNQDTQAKLRIIKYIFSLSYYQRVYHHQYCYDISNKQLQNIGNYSQPIITFLLWSRAKER